MIIPMTDMHTGKLVNLKMEILRPEDGGHWARFRFSEGEIYKTLLVANNSDVNSELLQKMAKLACYSIAKKRDNI